MCLPPLPSPLSLSICLSVCLSVSNFLLLLLYVLFFQGITFYLGLTRVLASLLVVLLAVDDRVVGQEREDKEDCS